MTEEQSSTTAKRCVTCGQAVEATYCSYCGEKFLTDKDHSIWHFVAEWFELFLHFDSKFLRTTKLLVLRPGWLTREYWTGRRVRYMKPFQLLILLNVFYYISAYVAARWHAGLSIMVPSLNDLMTNRIYAGIIAGFMKAHQSSSAIPWATYQHAFDLQLEHLSKTLVVLIVPMLAVILKLLFIRSRRPYLDHLVSAFHLTSFYITLGSVYLLLVGALNQFFGLSIWSADGIGWLKYLPLVALVSYAFVAFRTAYQQSFVWTTIATALLVFVGVTVITDVYDLILFGIAYGLM